MLKAGFPETPYCHDVEEQEDPGEDHTDTIEPEGVLPTPFVEGL